MKLIALALTVVAAGTTPQSAGKWYVGDKHCPPPKDDGRYSAPYNARDHQYDFPRFEGADKPGWSCSYQREDGVVVQFGDSRTPQEQWLGIWGNNSSVGN